MTRPLTRIPTVPCSNNTLIRCVIFLCFHLSLNLSPSTHLSACPFFFFLISNDHSFCCFCVWCQYGELNGRQLQKLLNDNFPHGELIYIMHTQNSQSSTKLWIMTKKLSFSVSTNRRNLERLWFGYLHEPDGSGGCILKRKM